MRSAYRLLTLAPMALVIGCGPRIEVRTMVAPDAGLSRMHTFRMLPGPARREGGPPEMADDPMIDNSIANRVLRAQIVKSLTERGYRESMDAADFAVAFYASAREKLDVTAWDYGYPFYPPWRRPRHRVVTTYTEGTVIVDVLQSNDRDRTLLWRGQGHTTLTNDPTENVELLSDAVRAIVAKFPRSTAVHVATQR